MRHTRAFSASSSAGVTLVEVMIVIVMIPLIIIAFIFVLDNTLYSAHQTAARAEYQSAIARATDRLEHDIRLASAFNSDISGSFSDDYAPVAGWTYAGTGTDDRVLILSLPATTVRDGASSRTTVYEDTAKYNCTTQLQNNPVLTYRAVYFINQGTLYKRFLTDTTTDSCGVQIQKQSCPAADIASWPASCGARDEIIATNVSRFSVDYLQYGLDTPLPNQYDDVASVTLARSVQISLTLSKTTSPAITTSASFTIARGI